MFKSMLGFNSGIILLYFSDKIIISSKESWINCETSQIFVFFLLGILNLSVFLAWLRKNSSIVWVSLCLITGFLYAQKDLTQYHNAKLDAEFDSRYFHLTAYQCGLPFRGDYSYRAIFCIHELKTADNTLLKGEAYKTQLSWPLEMAVSAGMHDFTIKARRLRFSQNKYGFAPEDSFLHQKIILNGAITQVGSAIEFDELPLLISIKSRFHQFRAWGKNWLSKQLNEATHSGVILALLLGDKGGLDKRHIDALNSTGTQHLLAISGLHIGLVMMGMFFFLPRTLMSLWIVGCVGLIYVLMVGMPTSALRAWVMSCLVILYLLGYFNRHPWRVYVLAMFVVLIIDPLSVYSLGFWYSFFCVGIIFLAMQCFPFIKNKLAGLVYFQVFIFIALIPVSSLLSARHGLESILANLLAIPWVTLLLLPCVFIWFFISVLSEALGGFVLSFLNASIEILIAFLDALGELHFSISIEPHVSIICLFFIALLLFSFFVYEKRVLVLALTSLFIVSVMPSRLYRELPEVVVFDVGQGLAMAIRSEDVLWLYDTGPAFMRFSNAQSVVLPYLRRHEKSNEVEGVIISHGDADHAGDLEAIFKEYSPGTVWSGEPERLSIKGFSACSEEMKWQVGNFHLEVLYPFSDSISESSQAPLSSNNHSCVIRFHLDGKTWLVMGDVEGQSEFDIVQRYREQLKADILVAGHHGARNGTQIALLKHVQPDLVIFSAGYQNRFGHPSQEVINRLAIMGVDYWLTAESGAYHSY